MNKSKRLGIELAIGCLLALAMSGPANAEEALWLVSGAEVTTLTSVETVGELLLEDSNTVVGKVAITKCSMIMDGSIGANGEAEVTELLTLAGVSISAQKLGTTAPGLACEAETLCGATENVAWFNKLPFQTLLELMTANGQILDVFLEFGWTMLCLMVNINFEDECTVRETGALVENMIGATALVIFNKESEAGNCQGGQEAGAGRLEEGGETKTLTGLEVTVVSP